MCVWWALMSCCCWLLFGPLIGNAGVYNMLFACCVWKETRVRGLLLLPIVVGDRTKTQEKEDVMPDDEERENPRR